MTPPAPPSTTSSLSRSYRGVLVTPGNIWSQPNNIWPHLFGGKFKLLRWLWWRRRRRRGEPAAMLLLCCALLAAHLHAATALRCYTTKDAAKGSSVECGLNTGCVKIFINSEEMLMRKQREFGFEFSGDLPTLPDRYKGNPILMRGCFVLAVPDRCYNADNGLSYCWCSTKDLCNGAPSVRTSKAVTVVAAVAIVLAWWGAT